MNAPTGRPRVVTASPAAFRATAQRLLQEQDANIVLSRLSEDGLRARLGLIDAVFTDADGTVVEEGHTRLDDDYAERIVELARAGVSVTMVTGKPYQEIRQLIGSFPPNLPLNVIYEKGAYYLKPNEAGILQKQYLLSTPELEASVAELRELFVREKTAIEQKHHDADGRPLVTLGWAGSGTHESVLSIDILQGALPENYLQLVGAEREALKIKDPSLLAAIEADLKTFTELHRPGWRLVHLGNGNSEIAPGPIEKDGAITSSPMFAAAHGVLVLGDSGNDQKMFALRDSQPAVMAGLVLHREKSLDLVASVDAVSFGMANARPLIDLLLQARKA